jgi:hypothetical protein
MTLGYAYSIVPSSSGFGLWEASPNDELISEDLLLEDNGYHYYLLGTDDLPDGVDDILGLIQNEPDQVYVFKSPNGSYTYFGFSPEVRELGNVPNKDLALSGSSEEIEPILELIGREDLVRSVTGILAGSTDGEFTEVWITCDRAIYSLESIYERIL